MSNVFFTADTHFNHKKVIEFEKTTRAFQTIEEHDEKIISNWNSVVCKKDIVYHLGDVYLGKDIQQFCGIINRLNGRKILIRGNHDTLPLYAYSSVFEDVLGVHSKYGFVMSHIPLHPDSVARWGKNVHGHLHSNNIQDNRYFCVSVEQHELKPVSLDIVKDWKDY